MPSTASEGLAWAISSKLEGDKQHRFRLRVGDWRIIFKREGKDAFRV
ncbi:MAG: hypothetical protein WBY44_24620 [Bryobacteraceae bacterium]|jgi:plasmid maintenance system killer protein